MLFSYMPLVAKQKLTWIKKKNKNLRVFSPSGCIEVLSTAKYQAAQTEDEKKCNPK